MTGACDADRRYTNGPSTRGHGSARIVSLSRHREPEIVFGEDAPFIPPGRYRAVGGKSRVYPCFRSWKVGVQWVIFPDPANPGIEEPVTLERHYNVTKVKGRLRAPGRGDLRRDCVMVLGRKPSRHHQLSPRMFESVMAIVDVRTVERDRVQRDLHEANRYSVIGRVVEILAGGRPAR